MNRRLLVQVSAPVVLIGLLLFVVCLVSVWFTIHSHGDLNKLLSQEVATMQAARELEIATRQLGFRSMLNVADPEHARKQPIDQAQDNFEIALKKARLVANSPRERQAVEAIATGYTMYQEELAVLLPPEPGTQFDYHKLSMAHPRRHVSEPCQELVQISKEEMDVAVRKSELLGRWLRATLLALGIIGPLCGVLGGWAIVRALSRSFNQLSVRVHDMARHLDHTVASVTLPADGDLVHLDRQLQDVVRRVEEAAVNLQKHQREMLRAEQLAAVGQLAASVAHELREPLTSIKGRVEVACIPDLRRPLTETDLAAIHQGIARLEQTVQNFLDFARPTAPRRGLGDFRDVITASVGLVQSRAHQLGITLDVHHPEEAVILDADRGQLSTVLVNLLLSVMDSIPAGGRLPVCFQSGLGDEAVLTIGEPYGVRGPVAADDTPIPTTSEKSKGLGLSLSISQRIIEEHGGRIEAVHDPAGGVSFSLVLPIPAPEKIHVNVARG